ncbi:uncharacterized protein LOC114742764 [Neltuma alba]|uniref:uncharacterized protein LOC114730799 n=1 Tax=Neltuma alba TaxID=207710 RepID=UPI0010A5822F|nr:uncharacterized protein LOC114730799 [Prosopis alba]XP_028786815.1 uncharacterized protein LOC114742764 [Prosopis alba]
MCGGAKVRDVFWCSISPFKILIDSLKIFLRNKRFFFSIFFFVSVPLSFLTFFLFISTYPLRAEIYHLEAVALVAPTRFEARHVWQESREDAIYLLRIKALFSIPCFVLSLFAAVAAVHATALSYNGKVPTLQSAATAFKQNWKRPTITAIFIYAILLALAPLQRIFALLAPTPELRLITLTLGSGVEVYLIAVLSLGLVVSISEERFGWEAIKVGSGLMEGRKFCGWVLSGLLVLVSGLIRGKMEVLMEGPITSSGFLSPTSTKGKMGIICAYGVAVVWSYVVTTVFYCECRRRHGVKELEHEEDEETGISML